MDSRERKWLFGALLLVVVVLIVWWIFANRRTREVSSPPQQSYQQPGTVAEPPANVNNTFPVRTQTGGMLNVDEQAIKNGTQIDPEGDRSLINSQGSSAIYSPKDQSFSITILAPPFEMNRKEAEEKLLESLQITRDQFCQLNVVVGVPFAVSEALSGTDYHVSFCPNGRPFPTQ